jgi:energy-converting hydrogenase B subunit D
MIEYILMIVAVLGAVIALTQRDLLKAAILTGISGAAIAFLFQFLLAPDVALTQAIVGTAIVPVFFALAVKKTRRMEED